jgi:hypothetical protein
MLPPAYVRLLCRQALAACDESWLERLLQKTWKSAKSDSELGVIHRALTQRVGLRNRLKSKVVCRASLISLGLNCLSWDVASRWGLRPPEDFWAVRSPFDSGAKQLSVVVDALENEFATYCTPEGLKAVETQGSHLAPMRKDVRAVWNHHLGSYWISDDFRRLRENMEAKAQTFREACRREDAVFLLSRLTIDFPTRPLDFLDRLNQGLERFTGRPRNRVIFLKEYSDTTATTWVDDWTVVLSRPFPSASYVWYDDATVDSDEGLAYEHGLVSEIMAVLSRWGLTSAGQAAEGPLAVPA